MKNLISNIKNFFYLYNLNISTFNKPLNLIKRVQKQYPTKNSIIRNLTAKNIKNWRSTNPYQPQNFSQAKELYNNYFTLPNHISSLNELKTANKYIIQFREELPIKGPRFSEYNIHTRWTNNNGPLIIHSSQFQKNYTHFTNWRYLTNDENIKYKKFLNEESNINNEIKNLKLQLESTRNKLYNLQKNKLI